jgi:hypothetical protein
MAVVILNVRVPDLDLFLPAYDRIQVWRATTQNGTYAEITAANETPAVVAGSVEGPWALSGKTLNIAANGVDPVAVVFTGVDPLGLLAAKNQINAVIADLAAEAPANSGKITLTSVLFGTPSSLLLSGNAAAVLGLSTTKVNGKANRILIAKPTEEYRFLDFDSNPTYWYKTRPCHSVTGRVGEFGLPRQGAPQTVIESDLLALGEVFLTEGQGKPVVGRKIILVPQATKLIGNYALLPGFDRVIVTTDDTGYASANLLIGATYRMLVEGAQFERTFVVPDETPFNLMEVATTAPDPFSIVQAPPRPIRMS